MITINDVNRFAAYGFGHTALALGCFDGVHRGHATILSRVVAMARAYGMSSGLLTFDPHPLEVIAPEVAPMLLSPGGEKSRLLAETGIDFAVVMPFTPALSQMVAQDFLREVLLGRLGMKMMTVGRDVRFGSGGQGDAVFLAHESAAGDFQVDVLSPVAVNGELVSSTSVREAVARGDIGSAAAMLGRGYAVTGPVVEGRRVGRTIGVPTANVAVHPRKLLPPDGVYAARVTIDRHRAPLPGVLNIGIRPTLDDGRARTFEVHIIGFDADIYDTVITVEIVAPVRHEQKFDSLLELSRQIDMDIAVALEQLN